MISSKATEKIHEVAISLLRASNSQSKYQIYKILYDHVIDHNTKLELEDVFSPSLWGHGSKELADWVDFGRCLPNISPEEINLGTRREWRQLRNGKRRVMESPENFYYASLLASLECCSTIK